jgi:hypothetical protein
MGVLNTALLGSEGPSNEEKCLFPLDCNKLPFWTDPFRNHYYFHSKRCTDYINRKLSSVHDKEKFETKRSLQKKDEPEIFDYYSQD